MTYGWVAGTGGLGAGITMRLVGDTSLGREESRAAELLDARDSCKLHIVLHYVQRLLGPGFPVHPIGAVGDDEAGRTVLEELRAVGMDVAGVRVIPDAPTLYAVAFVYPNGDGGNLTTTGSASDRVGPADLDSAAELLAGAGGIVVALPEVPIATRAALLARASGQPQGRGVRERRSGSDGCDPRERRPRRPQRRRGAGHRRGADRGSGRARGAGDLAAAGALPAPLDRADRRCLQAAGRGTERPSSTHRCRPPKW